MTDYIEWDGTESGLEKLLLWWGTRIKWEHSPYCDRDPRILHCCEGVSEFESKATIEGGSNLFHNPQCIPIKFSDGESFPEPVEVGDRIYYRGEGKFELVKR